MPERPRVSFVADETDEADLAAVFAQLAELGASGERVHPADLAFDARPGAVRAQRDGAPFAPDLVVGWVFEDWLAPGMAVLAMLRAAGLTVVNGGDVLFRGQNKALMSASLHAAAVEHEPVWFSWSTGAASAWARGADFPAVVKPGLAIAGGRTVRSSGGGVVRADDAASVDAVAGLLANLGQPLYAQRYVPKPDGRDIRVWVFGYDAVAACTKIPPAGTWITHASAGARLVHRQLDDALRAVAVASARAVGAPIAGIDVAEKPGGGYTVLEVNTCPTFVPADVLFGDAIARALAEFLLRSVPR